MISLYWEVEPPCTLDSASSLFRRSMLAPQQIIILIIQLMSVYGGFLTKKQSSQYYTVLEDLIKIIQSIVIDSLTKNVVDYATFRQPFLNSYKRLEKLQIRKYMDPKYSLSLKPLFELCFDHSFFRQKSFEMTQPLQQNLLHNFRDVESIKKSIDMNTKSLLASNDNPLQGFEKWRYSKSKTFRERKIVKDDITTLTGRNESSRIENEDRPNTTSVGHRKNKSIPVSGRLGSFLQDPKSSRKDIYQSFEKDYVMPTPSIEFERKLFSLRRGTKIKYQIEQLF